jgi:lipopolysaccharide transport system permease protein
LSVALPSRRSPGSPRLDLAWTLVRTDFKSRYHGSLGGFAWALLKPAAMFVALLAVFSFVFRAEVHYREKLLVGLFLWDFFAESTRSGITSLHQKGFLISRARFPNWIVVVASMANPLVTLVVFVGLLTITLLATGGFPGPLAIALFFSYLLALLAIVTGISLAGSGLFLRYRDLNQVWDVACQAGFFVAPIIWPIGAVPERYHFWLYLWPPTPVIEFSRTVLIDGGMPTARAHAYLALTAGAILGAGILLYRRLAPGAAEHL